MAATVFDSAGPDRLQSSHDPPALSQGIIRGDLIAIVCALRATMDKSSLDAVSRAPKPKSFFANLTGLHNHKLSRAMTSPLDANFNDYKKAETKALDILREMKTTSVKPLDIELALLVAIFELHRETMPAANIAGVIREHLETLEPFYEANQE